MNETTETSDKKARGGVARAKALTRKQRSEIARKGAEARWAIDLPKAAFDGTVKIAGKEIYCAMLPNGKRLLSQAEFLSAIGRIRRTKAGTGVYNGSDGLPTFLGAKALKPFISDELREATTPYFFVTKSGRRAAGYDAELLPKVCEVYLKYRDARLQKREKVPIYYQHIISACDILMRGLAHVGILALVDEATGYQHVRDAQALQEIVAQFIRKELAVWVQRFPEEFYKEIYRLKGWPWGGMSKNRYPVVGKMTIDLVYDRLPTGVLDELQRKSPKDDKGRRKNALHQWLSDDVGVPALAQHLYGLILLAKANSAWEPFYHLVERLMPKRNGKLFLPFPLDMDEITAFPNELEQLSAQSLSASQA